MGKHVFPAFLTCAAVNIGTWLHKGGVGCCLRSCCTSSSLYPPRTFAHASCDPPLCCTAAAAGCSALARQQGRGRAPRRWVDHSACLQSAGSSTTCFQPIGVLLRRNRPASAARYRCCGSASCHNILSRSSSQLEVISTKHTCGTCYLVLAPGAGNGDAYTAYLDTARRTERIGQRDCRVDGPIRSRPPKLPPPPGEVPVDGVFVPGESLLLSAADVAYVLNQDPGRWGRRCAVTHLGPLVHTATGCCCTGRAQARRCSWASGGSIGAG